jgi:hypothetical protein
LYYNVHTAPNSGISASDTKAKPISPKFQASPSGKVEITETDIPSCVPGDVGVVAEYQLKKITTSTCMVATDCEGKPVTEEYVSEEQVLEQRILLCESENDEFPEYTQLGETEGPLETQYNLCLPGTPVKCSDSPRKYRTPSRIVPREDFL